MNMIKRFNEFVNEEAEAAGNPVKEKIADLIEEIKASLSLDFWRSADDLMEVYKKLLPLKGQKVGAGSIQRYKEMSAAQSNPNLSALQYFNMMYGQIVGNQYGMGSGDYSFTDAIEKVGEKTLTGAEEKTADGKYTTSQVKKMIVDLIKSETRNLNDVQIFPVGR